MTRRKPVEESFQDWTERQIREAQARGAFDDLPGAGKPINDLDRPWSAERCVADLARREGIDLSVALPVPLRLRREREQLMASLGSLSTEQQVRDVVETFNAAVREGFRRPATGGPPMTVGLMDVDAVLERWRVSLAPSPAPAAAPPGAARSRCPRAAPPARS